MFKALVNSPFRNITHTIITRTITLQPLYTFSRRAKNSQLILHSPDQVDQIIAKRQENYAKLEAKPKSWKSGVEGQGRYRVSLVGLPNCGKSSLFNCLVGENIAIVDSHSGTTRDRKEFPVLEGLISIIDTPGVETDLLKKGAVSGNSLKEQIFKQTIAAIHESHMILLVIDSKKPVTQEEIKFAQYLKAFGSHAKIGVVFNKCDGLFDEGEVISEAAALGLGQPWTASAAEGSGVIELLNHMNDNVPQQMKEAFGSKRKKRQQKFEQLVKRLRTDIQKVSAEKGFNAGQWQSDFRRINPNPADNQALDGQNFEEFFIRPEQAFSNTRGAEARNTRLRGVIKICLIGRPNVGKSTLINELLGQQRVVVSSTPHTTRDSIRARLQYKQRQIELIDTAGINTPNLDRTEQEYLRKVQISTMAHVKQSHIVVYVMDAYSSMVIDDYDLIKSVIKEGRPVVIAVNKWEIVKQPYRYKAKNYLNKQLEKHLGELHGDPFVFISAKMAFGMPELLEKVINSYDKWNTRISTGLLNNWLQKFKKLQQMPRDNEHTLKINYLIQARVRPPHFVFFLNSRDLFQSHYERFLLRNLATEFGMNGIPLRLTLRSTNNRENKRVKPQERKQSAMNQKMEELKKKYGNFGL